MLKESTVESQSIDQLDILALVCLAMEKRQFVKEKNKILMAGNHNPFLRKLFKFTVENSKKIGGYGCLFYNTVKRTNIAENPKLFVQFSSGVYIGK